MLWVHASVIHRAQHEGPAICPAAEEEFQALCFDYGIELDDVVRSSNAVYGAAFALLVEPPCRWAH